MSRRPMNVVLMVFLVLAVTLAGCRRSAAPPVEELTPEDEESAAMQEAQENTETLEAEEGEPEATAEPEETETAEAEEGEETPESTVEPTATEAVVEEEEETPSPTATTETSTPPPTTGTTTHIVQPGENLFRIALRYGTTVEALAQANNITNPSLIYVGQELAIPTGAAQPAPQPGVKTYVVQPGDNLFRIALRHNYSTYYLARYNGISNPSTIYVGQVIRIP